MKHNESVGPIYTMRGYPVVAPAPNERTMGEFTGVYQMSNGQRTAEAARYFAHELGTHESTGGRLAERLSAESLAALSAVDGRSIKQLLADNNIRL